MMKNDAKQIDRFKEAARKAGADESDDALDRAFGALDLRRMPEAHHASDCSIHNGPAYPPGACDCGFKAER